MKKFKVTVEREDEYIVEFDDSINEEWMEEFRQFFYDIYSLEEHAEHIAQFRSRFGERFIEGYGRILENGKKPLFSSDDELNKAINIKVISEDDRISTNVEEVK